MSGELILAGILFVFALGMFSMIMDLLHSSVQDEYDRPLKINKPLTQISSLIEDYDDDQQFLDKEIL